ncbi:hypothetical protein HID58_075826 [Brassica napus]|uniref:Uncharacterized protein n=1 Tax=Brassica napus TaxID=3708 RepID=A0ABQ7YKR5_BRANA|nr:hypothetical protein HID58_075826 [Brassica napus]
MVDLSICCSEHNVSRFFSEHGGTLLMSWRSWPEPGDSYLSKLDKSLGLEAGGWRQGPIPGGRDPDLGAGTRDLEEGTWKPEAGEISSWNIFPQQFAPYFLAGNNMVLFIGLCELHRNIKFLVEFGVGRRLVMSDLENGPKSLTPCRDVVNMLQWACVRSLVVPLIPMTWKWIIRKNHHVGPSKCSKGGHQCHPPWWGLVGVGRRFDGEARNVCIKGDASAHTPDACDASDFSLDFLRLFGSMNHVEECMGQDPGIMRGTILARLRIRGMRRFNKTWRPKLRILVFVPVSLLHLAYLMLLELLASSRDCTLTFGKGDVQHVRLDNLVVSWYRSRILGHVVCGEQ